MRFNKAKQKFTHLFIETKRCEIETRLTDTEGKLEAKKREELPVGQPAFKYKLQGGGIEDITHYVRDESHQSIDKSLIAGIFKSDAEPAPLNSLCVKDM